MGEEKREIMKQADCRCRGEGGRRAVSWNTSLVETADFNGKEMKREEGRED